MIRMSDICLLKPQEFRSHIADLRDFQAVKETRIETDHCHDPPRMFHNVKKNVRSLG